MSSTIAKHKKSPLLTEKFGECYRNLSGKVAPDAAALSKMLGNAVAQTIPQVAQAFDLSPNTVKTSWRQAGMPGESGRYDLAEILAWRLAHDLANAERNKPRQLESKEKLEREILQEKLEQMRLDRLEREGVLIDKHKAISQMATIVSVAREGLVSIPQALEVSHGPKAATECSRLINHQLVALSEMSAKELAGE